MTLVLEDLTVRYGSRVAVAATGERALATGTLVALVGPNGAGKSSLLKAVARLIESDGRVRVAGRVLAELDARRRAQTVAYLAQDAAAHWPLSVRELVALGRLPYRAYGRAPDERDAEAVDWAMKRTGVAELAGRGVETLSGGELARVQLARALAVQAPILLADEPVAALDPFHQLEIMAELESYALAGRVVVVVMHDLALAARFCHRMLLLHAGTIVADGVPSDVLRPEMLERFYRVRPYVSRHEGQTVVVPWRTVG